MIIDSFMFSNKSEDMTLTYQFANDYFLFIMFKGKLGFEIP
jgi:hypothetical protein